MTPICPTNIIHSFCLGNTLQHRPRLTKSNLVHYPQMSHNRDENHLNYVFRSFKKQLWSWSLQKGIQGFWSRSLQKGIQGSDMEPTISVASTFFLMKTDRSMLQIFPQRTQNLWNDWELRTLILVSLVLQITLILFGTKRKHSAKTLVRFFLWLAYLSADTVATLALGVLSNNNSNGQDSTSAVSKHSVDQNNALKAFWAPFLLLHLGGPDNFTAYSLEDNELWLRQLLNLVFQVGVALYVVLLPWTAMPLNYFTIPMFIAGIIKYGERAWALRSASSQNFREALLPSPDPGPSYVNFMNEYSSRRDKGKSIAYAEVVEVIDGLSQIEETINPDVKLIYEALHLFPMLKRLYADLILNIQDIQSSLSILIKMNPLDVFTVIEIELGFLYDSLYTKADVVYCMSGIMRRSICISCILIAFTAFLTINTEQYAHINIAITYLILVVAIFLEIYGFLILLYSDWTILWLGKQRKLPAKVLLRAVSSWRTKNKHQRWSNSMAQHNLLLSCLSDEPKKFCWRKIMLGMNKIPGINKIIQMLRDKEVKEISTDLKQLIFQQLIVKSPNAQSLAKFKQLSNHRGEQVLKKMNCYNKLGSSILDVEFDQSILLWHIATDLCYYFDFKRYSAEDREPKSEISRVLSNYMMYILVNYPFMLPKGIGQIRYRDTCAEATEFFQGQKSMSNFDESQACMTLLQISTDIQPSVVKGDKSKSVLFDACRLAKSLQSLESEDSWKNEQKWEMICHVWIEMLSYAASQCAWNQHVHQLRRGGELLTHVGLLMAHLGLNDQFQIWQGEARTWV